jgi:transcriptional regulator with GAF, ATPase, and Fis domain/tetratricopeptide (TPR) repeat protein
MSGTTDAPDKLQTLRTQVASATTPAERVKATLFLAEELWLSDPVAAKPLLEQVLAEADAADRTKDGGRAAYMLGELLRRAGDLDGAARCAETVFKIADAAADRRMRASGLNLAGIIHRERDELQAALKCYREYLEISRQVGFEQGERIALNELAGVYGLQGEFAEALACYRLCLKADTEAGDARARAISLYNIGWTLAAMGRWTEATEDFHRAMALCEEHGFSDPLAAARMALGELSLKRSDYENAALMFRAVVEEERGKQHSGQMYREALSNLGWTHFRGGDLAQAEEVLNEAVRLSETAQDRRGLATICCRRAELALARGWLDAAGDLLAQAEHHATDLNLSREQGEALRVQALLSAARGESNQALQLFTRSEDTLKPLGDTYELALARLQRGHLLLESGRSEEALPLLKTAARAFHRLSTVTEAEEASRLLYQLEVRTDPAAALAQGLLSLHSMDLSPELFVERALALLCDNLRFEHGAVLVNAHAVALRGDPDLTRLPKPRSLPLQTDLALFLPMRQDRRPLGFLWLSRMKPLAARADPGLLVLVSRTLASSLAELKKLERIGVSRAPLIPGLRIGGVVGCNREVIEVLRQIPRIAEGPGAMSVLIRGETGTGKELVARALHDSGPRADYPFVAVNCTAVPESLLEAEFFGVEAGAATGVVARPGKFELAHMGTIFLDEIGDMSPGLQAKLLRVLEDHKIMRVGGTRETPVDVRVVAATNMDLDMRAREGKFRTDLLFRLNTIPFDLPPLRRRREDIPVLTEYFIVRTAQEYKRPVHGASDEAMALLTGYSWPGNIRQLRHVVERAVVLAAGERLGVSDLPREFRTAPDRPAGAVQRRRCKAVDKAERMMLVKALRRTHGNISQAAKQTGYSRAQFYRLLRKHNITRSE